MNNDLPQKIDIGQAPEDILELSNEEIMEEFLAILEASGASPETVKSYRAAIKDFLEYIGDKPLRNVRITDVIKWRNHKLKNGFHKTRSRDKNSQKVTLHYYNLFIRRFLKWLGIRIHIPNVKKPPRRIETLSDEEIRKLYSAVKNPLDKIILDLLLDTGLRSRELLGLRVRDVDFENNVITVFNAKYGKERKVIATPQTIEELKTWIQLNNLGENDRIIPLTYSGLYKRLKRLAKRAGVNPSKIHPHIFRHTFATRALRGGMNILSLQRLLGHSDIRTTQIYTHLTIEDIRTEYMQAMTINRKCPVCGKPIPLNAQYCPYCGTPLSNKEKYTLQTSTY